MTMLPRVLVTFGSKRGGTAGIAAQIGETLRAEGNAVDVLPVGEVGDLSRYDAVVIGGALYMARWVRSARRFVRRNAEALNRLPVWMFSSGPLDATAAEHDIPPTSSVRTLMAIAGARGHATFGGRLEPDARGFPAAQMAKQRSGDWRDPAQIARWARDVGHDLAAIPARAPLDRVREPRPNRFAGVLCLVVGLFAIGGGLGLVARPDGSALGLPLSVLDHAPFASFLVPGLLLLVVVGVGSMLAGVLVLRDGQRYAPVAFAAGGAQLIWIVAQMIMLRSINGLQIACFAAALAILAASRPHGVSIMRPSRA